MKFEIGRRPLEDGDEIIEFQGKYYMSELVALPLDALDLGVLRETSTAKDVTAADLLMALEIIFRAEERKEKECLPTNS